MMLAIQELLAELAGQLFSKPSFPSSNPSPASFTTAPARCRYCRCTEDSPCRLASGDACAWSNRGRTVCTNPACLNRAHQRGGAR